MQTPIEILFDDLLGGNMIAALAAKEKYLQMEKESHIHFFQQGFVECGRFVRSVAEKTKDNSLKGEEYYNQKFQK